MKKHLKYASYIVRHKWFVFVECCRLNIPWLGVTHDLSKLCLDEWLPYTNFFYGDRPSPTTDQAFDFAWLKHIHRNKHHWQWWVLKEDEGDIKCLPMPDRYRREMLADWRGAGKAQGFGDNTASWYQAHKNSMGLHPETRAWIEWELTHE